MIDKKTKLELLESIKDKDERTVISSVLDKAIKYEKSNNVSVTNFLNLSEFSTAKKMLDYLGIKYVVFSVNDYIEKKNIAFVPDYLDSSKVFSEHVSCLKVTSKSSKLMHKDYMGAIYSLGVKHEFVGDIIVRGTSAYFFCMKNMEEYFLTNLTSVGRNEVKVEVLYVLSDEVKNLSFSFSEKEYIVPSLRVDAILSEVYGLSRNEVKEKIVKGDLYINDKNMFYPSTLLKENDVISFRRCGKFRMGKKVRETKSLNLVVIIYKYS